MRRCVEAIRMNKIGLLPNPEKDPDLFYSGRICEFLVQSGAQVYTSPEFAISMPDGVVSVPRAEIFSCADCVVTLGGDGTLLRIAHEAARHSKPIMGVNFGKIGYMAELEYNEIEKLSRLLSGQFAIEKRLMLDVRVHRGGRTVFKSIALNDAVISQGRHCPPDRAARRRRRRPRVRLPCRRDHPVHAHRLHRLLHVRRRPDSGAEHGGDHHDPGLSAFACGAPHRLFQRRRNRGYDA